MKSERTIQPGTSAMSIDGFTLVELAIVIAVIALLAILIFPALAKSRDDGGRVVCTNNLRQMGLASNMYASDNSDFLAYPNWDGGIALSPGWLYAVTAGTIPDPTSPVYSSKPASAYSSGLWFPYAKDYHSYLCPVDIRSPSYTAKTGSAGARNNKLCSYVMDGAVCGFQTIYRTCKTSDAWNPGCYLLWEPNENLLGPGNPGPFDYNDGANYPNLNEGLGGLHVLNGGEALTVAGNVQFVTVQQFQLQSSTQGRSLSWWNPLTSSGH
jgi:prepilin-type N-terminal cleavage/methylation domain-containing protein